MSLRAGDIPNWGTAPSQARRTQDIGAEKGAYQGRTGSSAVELFSFPLFRTSERVQGDRLHMRERRCLETSYEVRWVNGRNKG